MIIDPFAPLGVVPIVVNAGAALLPAIVVSVTSVVALLLKPRELLALFRRKPWLPVAILGAAGIVWFLVAWTFASPTQAASTRLNEQTDPTRIDWTAVALKIIEDEKHANKATGVKPLWDYPADEGMVLSTPLFVDGKVIGSAAIQDVAAYFGQLYALDAATGNTPIWKLDQVDGEDLKPFVSSPTLTADKKAFVIGQGLHEHRDCYLLCVEVATGKLRWKVKTPLHIESSPAVHGDLAVVGAGAIEEGPSHKPTDDPGYVFAVRVSDGKEVWRHPVNDPESSPTVAPDGTVYIGSGFNGNAVVALRSESDDELKAQNLTRQIWKTNAPYPITGPVSLVDDLVLVGGGNGDFVSADPNPAGVVLALDRKTGAVRWQAPMEDAVLNQIVVRDGRVYCPVRNGQVVALNLADGKPVWKQSLVGRAPVKAGLVLDGGVLFAVSSDGYLVLLNAADGKPIERHPINHPAKPGKGGYSLSTPTVAGGKVFVGSETGGMRCFEVIGGK